MVCKKYLVFILLLMATNFVSAQKQNIRFQHIDVTNGLSHNTVHAVFQDSRGFMWFGTEDGLNRYDGYNFKVFRPITGDSSSISDIFVNTIFEDSQKNLWIGTNNGGLNLYDRKTEKFIRFQNNNRAGDISDNNIRVIFEDNQHRLWVGTKFRGLNLFVPEKKQFKNYFEQAIPYKDIRCIFQEKNSKKLWVGTNHNGLILFDPDQEKIVKRYINNPNQNQSISNNEVNKIFVDSQNRFWVATRNGLNLFDPKTETFEHFFAQKDNLNSLPNNAITNILEDVLGNLWFSTGGGLAMLPKTEDTFYQYTHNDANSESLSRNYILSMFLDKTNILWIGTSEGGLNKYDRHTQKFKHFKNIPNNPNSLSFNTIRSLFAENEHTLWIGTLGEGIDKFNLNTGTFTHIKTGKNKLSNGQISAILKDKSGDLWVGTWEKGVNRITFTENDTIFSYYSIENGKSTGRTIQNIKQDRHGRIWVGTENGLELYVPQHDKFMLFAKKTQANDQNTIISNSIQSNAFVEDRAGNFWIGTWEGLTYMKLSGDDNIPTAQYEIFYNDKNNAKSLSDNRIISLCLAGNDTLWIGTYGGGLNRMVRSGNTYHFNAYTTEHGLANGVIYGILIDQNGILWLSTNNGLSSFNPNTEKFKNFDVADGLQSNVFFWGASAQLAPNLMAFGGINGINIFRPEDTKANPYKPEVAITKMQLFNEDIHIENAGVLERAISETHEIMLNYNQNMISFEFAALHFSYPEDNKYKYMLEGLDKNWIETSSERRFVSYTNLKHGEYTFKVKAANCDDVWADSSRKIKIVIKPPIWETWWFKTLGIIFFVGLLVGFYRWRVYQIKKTNKQLEVLVKERTEEVEQQKEELITANSELEARNTQIQQQNSFIKSSIQYAQNIQSAILPLESSIKKLFDSFIIFKPKDIVSGDFYWFTMTNTHTAYLAVVDCTGHGVPGAFMSMIGSRIINDIIIEHQIDSPAEILELLDAETRKALKQDTSENNDGMDVCLCKIELPSEKQTTYNVTFAGAKRPLYYAESGNADIKKIRGTRKSIGGVKSKHNKEAFSNNELKLEAQAMLYLSSDGLIDQPNPQRKRFGSQKLMNLLSQIHADEPILQKSMLLDVLKSYQSTASQRDDITVVGIKL